MQDIISKIENNIKKYNLIVPKDKIIVGVSGGPDSIMLFTALLQLKPKYDFEFIVAHVNHMIREEAGMDENLVREICAKNGIEIHVLTIDVLNEAKAQKISTEECGRNIRYEFFNKLIKDTGANKIAVAHNLGDNAETIFMNIIRGTGLSGLTGMDYSNGNVIRPMLNIDKKDILGYLDKNNISYAIDKTNYTNDYTRNYIRNELITRLREINPNILNTIDRMKDNLKQDENVLNKYTKTLAEQIILKKEDNELLLNVKLFKMKDEEIKPRIIRYILNELLNTLQGIEQVHIEDICELFNKCITGKKYIIGKKFHKDILKNKKAKCVKVNTIIE